MKHIASLGHTYCIRLKQNMKVLVYDKNEKHKIWKWIGDLFIHKAKSTYYENIMLSEKKYKTNIVFSKKNGYSEPWIIVTNGSPTRALKDYSYRFGSIESVFKNQKSNGFYLESTVKASIKYFESLYTLTCFATLFLTLLGTDYSKNTKCYKNVKIITHKNFNGIKKRVMSLFNTGLTLFHLAFNSLKYIRLSFNFMLYDI